MKISNETKTGIFVLICLAALFGLLIKVGNFSFFKKGYTIRTRFQFTGGIKPNAPVRLSGVDIGEVRGIRLVHESQSTVAEVDLWLVDSAKVRKDSIATVSTLGMMGEKYVELRVGTSPEFVAANDVLESTEPARLEDLVEIGKKVAADVGNMAKSISKVADNLDGTLQENRPRINRIFENLESTSENFEAFSEDVKFHPWKVLAKGKEVPKEQLLKDRETRKAARDQKKAALAAEPVKQNFARG